MRVACLLCSLSLLSLLWLTNIRWFPKSVYQKFWIAILLLIFVKYDWHKNLLKRTKSDYNFWFKTKWFYIIKNFYQMSNDIVLIHNLIIKCCENWFSKQQCKHITLDRIIIIMMMMMMMMMYMQVYLYVRATSFPHICLHCKSYLCFPLIYIKIKVNSVNSFFERRKFSLNQDVPQR